MDPPSDLRPGLTAQLRVLSYREEDALVIPRRFLRWTESGVSVVTPQGLRFFEAGRGNARGVIAVSGLEPGMELVQP
jgi:hypothetical protein